MEFTPMPSNYAGGIPAGSDLAVRCPAHPDNDVLLMGFDEIGTISPECVESGSCRSTEEQVGFVKEKS
jgi:hypothetical protein